LSTRSPGRRCRKKYTPRDLLARAVQRRLLDALERAGLRLALNTEIDSYDGTPDAVEIRLMVSRPTADLVDVLQCGNCGKHQASPGHNDCMAAMARIPNLMERLDPGGIVPSGTCPDCGSLTYFARVDKARAIAEHLLS